jgi:hypothetical protein
MKASPDNLHMISFQESETLTVTPSTGRHWPKVQLRGQQEPIAPRRQSIRARRGPCRRFNALDVAAACLLVAGNEGGGNIPGVARRRGEPPHRVGYPESGLWSAKRFDQFPKLKRSLRAGAVFVVSIPLTLWGATAGTVHPTHLPAPHSRGTTGLTRSL